MNIALWGLQVVAALGFALAGFPKLTQPHERLKTMLPWTANFSTLAVRLIGIAEILGALGLVLPPLLHVATVLAPVAAGCLAVLMIGAASYHLQHKELNRISPSVVLLILSVIILVGRLSWAPLA